jgi:hypothetical protein
MNMNFKTASKKGIRVWRSIRIPRGDSGFDLDGRGSEDAVSLDELKSRVGGPRAGHSHRVLLH